MTPKSTYFTLDTPLQIPDAHIHKSHKVFSTYTRGTGFCTIPSIISKTGFWWGNLRGKNYLGGPGLDGK